MDTMAFQMQTFAVVLYLSRKIFEAGSDNALGRQDKGGNAVITKRVL